MTAAGWHAENMTKAGEVLRRVGLTAERRQRILVTGVVARASHLSRPRKV